jgi:amino acid adenylation domain-containing protein
MTRLRSIGIGLVASGGRLRVTAARGELTEQIKQAITAQKGELLDLLAEEASGSPADVVAIPRNRALPLSSFQQRLWVLHRIEPESTAYNMVTVWPCEESTSVARVERAIRAVIRDNEILRTTFRDHGAAPAAHLLPPEAVSVSIRDLSDRTTDEQQGIVRQDVSQETRRPFQLATEPSVRWVVYQLGAGRAATLVAAHHIAMDEWSLSLLRNQLAIAWAAATTTPPEPRPPTLQYTDYAAWQLRTQSQATLAAELAWWENKLAGIPQLCTFQADRPSTDNPTGSTRPFCWDKELVNGLRSLVRRQNATIYSALLALCAAVLCLHTGQDDIVLGSPMGVRERPEFETMLGPFVNLLVLRLDLADDPSFSELVTRARDAVLDAYDHRQIPFEMLVERLSPARSFDRPPLFQVGVVLHNASDGPAALIYGGGAVQDLTWYAREVDGCIEGTLEFRSDIYDYDTIDRIAIHLETALRVALNDPERRVSQISLLTSTEREQVLHQFNATALQIDAASFAVQFERQAARCDDRPAISFNSTLLTYDALNQRANRLARYLRSLGLGTGALVGVCVERSPAMVVTLLAVQKAGAAYVPIDPDFPARRLNLMMMDSGLDALVTTAEIAVRLEIPVGVRVIDVGSESVACDKFDGSDLGHATSPHDIAYIIYTSGSTGRPNGVAVSHGALSNFLAAMRCTPGMTAADVMVAVTTVSFDIAALELFLPLTVGARVELASRQIATDGTALAQLLSTAGATVLQATPATWRLLIEAGWQGHDKLRAFCGGEAVSRHLADILLKNVKELWNLYGPTETTIWSTAARIENGANPISIGRPIANTRVYILDSDRQPSAIGIPGEVWIGGDGVAIGYHRNPELTAERFVPDPFSPRPSARMYRTGDIGRWNTGGQLFHIGRKDRQVKLRGFRIELNEIEEALSTHPAVSQVVVTARDSASDDAKLVAYVVYHPAVDLTSSEARTYLRSILPEYMTPSIFMSLDAVPMTPNGKVDHRSLPDPFENTLLSRRSFEPPIPGLEQLIAGIWQDLLRCERVGADDNFFELGGHSLLSLRAAVAIEKHTGCRIQPRIMFFQNLRQVAAAIRREQPGEMFAK